jgi:hypothetical protein
MRLFVSCIGSFALLVVAVLSALPYGGGSFFVGLWLPASIALFIWSLLPLERLFSPKDSETHDAP